MRVTRSWTEGPLSNAVYEIDRSYEFLRPIALAASVVLAAGRDERGLIEIDQVIGMERSRAHVAQHLNRAKIVVDLCQCLWATIPASC